MRPFLGMANGAEILNNSNLKWRYQILLAVLTLLVFTVPAVADQSDHSDQLNKTRLQLLFSEAVEISSAVGVQVSLIKGDEQLDFVHGMANADLGIPLIQETVIQIGSTTKIFNAAIAMTLAEEGKLDLDVPVKTYLPEFQVADEVATSTITMRRLFSMSSGLDNGPYTAHGGGEDALARYVESLSDLPQAYEPGKGFGYSNAGTSIAGYTSERIAGKSWDDLLMDRIFKPAGLNNAATLERDLMFQRVSAGHAVNPETGEVMVIKPWHITRAQGPAGSTLAMSAHDLARFGKIFLNEGIADNGTRILSAESVTAMTTATTPVPSGMAEAWGLGPYQFDWNGTELWGHAGGNMSGTSDLRWIPEMEGVIAVVCNTPAALGRFLKILHTQIAQEAFGISIPLLEKPANPAVISNPDRFTGTYKGVGGSFIVEVNDEQSLKMTMISEIAPESSVILLPIGADRFYLDAGEAADLLTMAGDVAFFGEDDKGRATSILPGPFAFGRSD